MCIVHVDVGSLIPRILLLGQYGVYLVLLNRIFMFSKADMAERRSAAGAKGYKRLCDVIVLAPVVHVTRVFFFLGGQYASVS